DAVLVGDADRSDLATGQIDLVGDRSDQVARTDARSPADRDVEEAGRFGVVAGPLVERAVLVAAWSLAALGPVRPLPAFDTAGVGDLDLVVLAGSRRVVGQRQCG